MSTLINTLIALLLSAIFGQPGEEQKPAPPNHQETSVKMEKTNTTRNFPLLKNKSLLSGGFSVSLFKITNLMINKISLSPPALQLFCHYSSGTG